MTYPEILLYSILVSDLSSTMDSSKKDSRDELTQERIYEVQQELLNKYLQGNKYNKKVDPPEQDHFYSALMHSFEAKIVANYEKKIQKY